MTWLSRFTCFFLAVALSCVSALAFLNHQNSLGIPMSFVANMTLAALIGLVVPIAAVIAFAWLRKSSTGLARFLVYYAVCLVSAGLIALLTY